MPDFTGARLWLNRQPDIRRRPGSLYAVIGIYLYDGTVFEIVRKLVPSRRNELEITDVNNAYIQEGTMS